MSDIGHRAGVRAPYLSVAPWGDPGQPRFSVAAVRFALGRDETLDGVGRIRHKSRPPAPGVSSDAVLAAAERESIMSKMKTNRAAAKRFRITASGKVRRPKANGQHGMIGKSRKRRRRLRNNDIVAQGTERRIKILLPYG
jgi:large subunit ribosomal protein L35